MDSTLRPYLYNHIKLSWYSQSEFSRLKEVFLTNSWYIGTAGGCKKGHFLAFGRKPLTAVTEYRILFEIGESMAA